MLVLHRKQFSESYQSGALSFEFFYLKNKIVTNCGYFQKNNHQLNKISKSSATHSSLIIENRSINFFQKINLERFYRKFI